MASYYITHRVTMTGDPAVMVEYSSKVNATIERYGGHKIVRSRDIAVIEGDWDPDQMTIIEFPDRAAAMAWYNSPEYAPLKAMRHGVSTANAIIVDSI